MIAIPDNIGEWWGLCSDDVLNILSGKDVTEIVVPISCFGGDVFEAFNIYNILKSHPAKVTAYLYGKCMSAGTIVACAADEILAVPQLVYMIHQAEIDICGGQNQDDAKKALQILAASDDMIAATIAKRSKNTKADILDLMKVESYFTTEQAVQMGFIDGIVDTIPFDFQISGDDTYIKDTPSVNYQDAMGYDIWDKLKLNIKNSDRFRVFNNADLSKFAQNRKNTEGSKPQIDNSKDFSKMELKNIWNAVKSFIAPDKHDEAKAAIEAQSNTIVLEISNSVNESFKQRFEGLAKKEDLKVVNFADIKKAFNEATLEEKAEILKDLGYESPDAVTPVQETEAFKDLVNEFAAVKKQLGEKLNIKNLNPSNGGGLPPSNDAKTETPQNQASKLMLKKMFDAGHLPQNVYDEQLAKLG